ncbi:Serpentine receptor class gamma-10 [Caenorhabditis elegans]|uniref:Serpentine receptor class gamma-10 n=1 Tax=Caenorhabditis elegans TaxID=6239 RepID=SRG10_CAEEL|nr:Serpentine receptor class gamma-10 [Caenorhabditis elegans]P46568.1 RecName: Full=Serpentine receptor class gamma-10; Short=Protein srg-10 [Caenorhabditis elegans]CAA84725.1 Serpentine receptor class gamma-10 [Caenorhabditis elegans]|eukprot:NP_497954.1 Serpentine receptor class gamma-10 [Caenorhabditis elegans]
MNSSRVVFPANFSYEDPLPFECNEDPNVVLSLAMYGMQSSYLIVGAVLNVMIVYTVFHGNSYRDNSFYMLYCADAIVGIYINTAEVIFGRIFIYITPLCPIASPYFFTPSILTKMYYAALHYSLGFKTFSQIFMSFNRMTCVIFLMKHLKLWKQILKPVLIITFILPLGVIWKILLSRVYINPNGAGFSVNYKDYFPWANISILHLFHFTLCFVLVIIFFVATILGLTMLKQRIKSAERSLTIVTMIMAVQTVTFASIQIYFVFFAAYTPKIRSVLLQIVSFVFDSLYVFSPIALIVMSRQLRKDIFNLKDKETQISMYPNSEL